MFRQESELGKKLLELLNSVIGQDEILSSGLASYQPWSASNEHSAALGDITVKLEGAEAEVSHKTFNGF